MHKVVSPNDLKTRLFRPWLLALSFIAGWLGYHMIHWCCCGSLACAWRATILLAALTYMTGLTIIKHRKLNRILSAVSSER